MNDESPPAPAHYLLPEQLRVGIFVELELPWFKHNFALSAFKIRNESQLREVLELRLARYRYDPARSDALPDAASGPAPTPVPEAPAPILEAAPPVDLGPEQLARQQRALFMARREQRISEVEKAFAKATGVLRNLNRNLLTKPAETVAEMGALVEEMVAAFLESTEVTLHVMGEKAGGEDVYFHSLNVTILAMMLAKDLAFSPEMARELGVGAMIHDIGLIEIPDRVVKKNPGDYTSAERNLRAMHVEHGVDIGRRVGLSAEALAVIAQHHEFADGSGYPKGLKEAAMTPAARVVSLVNHYDNLCNPIDLSAAMTPHDALSLMFAQRRNKFEARALALMIRSLGVYPPGSIVQLSNEAVASVISINPKRPLRPCVVVYDPKIPKEEAIVLDLEQDASISIAKSIRPAALPPKVAAYLNPRKRVTYFFDSNGERPPGSA